MSSLNENNDFKEFVVQLSNESPIKLKEIMTVNLLYYIFTNLIYILNYNIFNLTNFITMLIIVIAISYGEYKSKHDLIIYYQLKVIVLLFIVNISIFSLSTSIIITIIGYILYLFERMREIQAKYNQFISGKKNDNRALAVTTAAITMVVLKFINPIFSGSWYEQALVVIALNILFSIEFNLIHNPYDLRFLRLVKK